MSSFLSSITPGSWPDWVAALGTSFAFIVAAFSYLRSTRERRESQARLVYSKVTHLSFFDAGEILETLPNGATQGTGDWVTRIVPKQAPGGASSLVALAPGVRATVAIHNGSKELIGPAKVQVVNTGLRKTLADFAAITGVIDPESETIVDFTFANPQHPGQPSIGSTVIFRDASGSWWRRRLFDPIEHVHADPENGAPTPTERAQYAKNALALGLVPAEEVRVPLRARLHRLGRRLRRKDPLP